MSIEHWTVSTLTIKINAENSIASIVSNKEKKASEVFDFKKIGTEKEQQQLQQQRMNNVSYGSI